MNEEAKEAINVMKNMFNILNDKIGTLSCKMNDIQRDITVLKQVK